MGGPLMRVFCSTVISPAHAEKVKGLGMGVLFASSSDFLPSRKFAEAHLQGVPIAVDNGAFGAFNKGYWFNEHAFLATLDAIQRAGLKPEWIVAPDLVAQGRKSLDFSVSWATTRLIGAPLALAVQDGMTAEDVVPVLHLFRCLFVGGTVEWKWETAKVWADLAHANAMTCHVGRCGNSSLMARAEVAGADSCDSSSFQQNDTWHYVEDYQNGKTAPDLFA